MQQLVLLNDSSAQPHDITRDPTVAKLAAHLEDNIEELGGFSLSNVAWACRNMELGSPHFLPKVGLPYLVLLRPYLPSSSSD